MTLTKLFENFLFLEPNQTNNSSILEDLFFKFSIKEYFDLISRLSVDEINCLAESRAIKMFHATAQHVPAYKDFLKKQKINPVKIKSISDFKKLPIIDKNNYLNNYPRKSLYWNGDIKGLTMMSVSSGSTGKPYYWPRSVLLEYETAITHEIFLNTFFDIKNVKTLVIDAYAMGMYVAGTFTLNSFRKIAKKNYPLLVVSPGIEENEVLRIINDLGGDFEQVIITGYPPFVKDIIDAGIAVGINWKRYNIKFIFGAENFSENWRTYLLKLVGIEGESNIIKSSMNTYGSADCAVLGHETPMSIKIRRFVNENNIQEKIFSQSSAPTLVQYNPLLRYFESVKNELIFTAQGGIPLIRYNIKDKGYLLNYQTLSERFSKNDYSQPEVANDIWTKFPFLYLLGRINNTVTLYGLNIYPENIKAALEDKEIINLVSGKFTLATKYDKNYNQFLEISIELRSNRKLISSHERLIQKKIVENLRKLNFEYSKLFQKIGIRAEPRTIFLLRDVFKQVDSKHRWIKN